MDLIIRDQNDWRDVGRLRFRCIAISICSSCFY